MRCCPASAARVLTLFCIALFSSQSLLLVSAADTDPIGSLFPVGDQPSTTSSDAATSTSSSSVAVTTSSSSSLVNSPPPATSTSSSIFSQPTTTSSSVHKTSSSTAPLPSTTSQSSLSSSSSSSSSTVSSTSSSSSSSSSSSTPSTSSTASSTSTTSSSSSSSHSVTSTSHSASLVAAATTFALTVNNFSSSFTRPTTSASSTATDAALSGTSASSKGFFNNKGAVAGTFSVVGLVIVGGLIAAIVYAKRRAARLQDEEDMTYFEKYDAPNNTSNASFSDAAHGSEPEMSYSGHGGAPAMDVNDEPLATHAAVDAYPDRATHFGLPTMDEYAQPSGMGLQFANAGVDYPPGMAPQAGVEYPPGMAYNPAQYGGYEGGYGYAATQHQQPYYDPSSLAPAMTHPYANPSNSPRIPAAPPVQQPFFGEAN